MDALASAPEDPPCWASGPWGGSQLPTWEACSDKRLLKAQHSVCYEVGSPVHQRIVVLVAINADKSALRQSRMDWSNWMKERIRGNNNSVWHGVETAKRPTSPIFVAA